MNKAGDLREKLKKIVADPQLFSKMCKVVSVDESSMTCDVSYLDNPDIKIYDVKLSPLKDGLNVLIPEVDSIVIIDWISQDQAYVSMFSEVKQYYQATSDESILDIMLDFIKAIKAIQLLHPQSPTSANGVINIQDFLDLEQRLKKFYLK